MDQPPPATTRISSSAVTMTSTAASPVERPDASTQGRSTVARAIGRIPREQVRHRPVRQRPTVPSRELGDVLSVDGRCSLRALSRRDRRTDPRGRWSTWSWEPTSTRMPVAERGVEDRQHAGNAPLGRDHGDVGRGRFVDEVPLEPSTDTGKHEGSLADPSKTEGLEATRHLDHRWWRWRGDAEPSSRRRDRIPM